MIDWDRFKEPSTWAGFGLLATGVGWSADQFQLFVQIVTAGAGLLAILFRSKNGDR